MKTVGLSGSAGSAFLPRGGAAEPGRSEDIPSFADALKPQTRPTVQSAAEPDDGSSSPDAGPASSRSPDRAGSSAERRTSAMEKAEDEDDVRTSDVDDALVPKPTTAAVPEHSRTARTEGAAGDDDRAGKGQESEDRPDEPADAPAGVPPLPVAIASDTDLRAANPDSMTSEGGQSASQVRAHANDRAGSKGAADVASTAAADAPAEPDTARARSKSAADTREAVADTAGARSAAETTRNETSRGAPGLAAEIGIAAARYAVPPRSDNAGAPRSGIRLSERSAALSLDRVQARQAADVVDLDNADARPNTAVANDDPGEISGSRSDRNDRGGDRNPDRRTITEAGVSVSGTQAATVPPGAAPLVAPATGSPAAALSQAIALEPSWRPETVAAMTQAQAYRGTNSPSTLHVQLTPGSLGTIDASLKMVGTQLEIEIRVETHEAMERLEGERHLIEKTLRSLGYDLSQLSILQSRVAVSSSGEAASTSAGGGTANHYQADANSSSGGNGSNDRHPHGARDTTALAGREAARSTGSDRRGVYI